jgi:hypothetical protein
LEQPSKSFANEIVVVREDDSNGQGLDVGRRNSNA